MASLDQSVQFCSTNTTNENKYAALVLDSAAFLSNTVSPSSLLSRAEKTYTTPDVISEIKDSHARSRLNLQWLPFLEVRSARSKSVDKILEVAKKTGDKEVLSSTDLGVLALALELETELRGNEDWMRSSIESLKALVRGTSNDGVSNTVQANENANNIEDEVKNDGHSQPDTNMTSIPVTMFPEEAIANSYEPGPSSDQGESRVSGSEVSNENSDEEGWITPSNIRRHQLEENLSSSNYQLTTGQVFVACATSDFAMQNVLLLLPIPVVTPSSPTIRITSVRTWLLRCHACFFITRVMSNQFCPRCGGPTLLRTSCTTDAETGETKIYLKKNFQWNKRGNVYSIPKPTGGRSSGKAGNGVKTELLLRGDQKEYVRQKEEIERISRKGERDLMDRDYLPGILTGERRSGRDRVQIGHGRRNPNAKTHGKRK